MDHKNLEYFKTPQHLNTRQARWYVFLQDYNYTLHYMPGKRMQVPDFLSRQAHLEGLVSPDTVTLIPASRIAYLGTEAITDLILKHQGQVDTATQHKAVRKTEECTVAEDGSILRRGCKVVPSVNHVIAEVIHSHHDTQVAGHPGVKNTLERIQRSYWWPTIQNDVEKYVKSCQTCQATKIDNSKRRAPLHPNPVPSQNWEYISVDMITGLPEDQGYNAILVVVDTKSKDFHAIPCRDSLTSEQYATLYRDKIFTVHGLSKRIYSDRGPQFVSSFIKAVYKLLGIEGNPSTAYHPQTDGQTEHINQEIKKYLRIFAKYDGWASLLPMAEFKYRTQVHSGSKFSPFMLNHGYEAYTGVEKTHTSDNITAEEYVETMKKMGEQAEKALKKAKESMKKQYDKKRKGAVEYEKGDQVWLDAVNLPLEEGTRKLAPKRVGPFEVIEKVGQAAYRLKLPKSMSRIHPVFNEVLLTKHIPPAFEIQKLKIKIPAMVPPPPPKVAQVFESRHQAGGIQYLVTMEGTDTSKQWRPRSEIVKANGELLHAFHEKHPDAPTPLLIRVPPAAEQRALDTESALRVKLLSSTSKAPTRGSADAAGYDLYSDEDTTIPAGSRLPIHCGIAIALPPNTYARIAPRSGLAVKHSIDIAAGVVDADYRGAVRAVLVNNGVETFTIAKGDRVAQLVLEMCRTPPVHVVDELEQTKRGDQGFGSTGVKEAGLRGKEKEFVDEDSSRWGRKARAWKARAAKEQGILPISTKDIEHISRRPDPSEPQHIVATDERLDVQYFWLYNKDKAKITHRVQVRPARSWNHHW